MHQPIRSETNDLHQASEAFSNWRQHKATKQARIPGELWQLACREAKSHGVSRTSRALKIDYYRFKRHLNGQLDSGRNTRDRSRRQPESRAAFVELPAAAIAGSTECELELENGEDTRLMLRWRGSTAPDLSLLGQLLAQS